MVLTPSPLSVWPTGASARILAIVGSWGRPERLLGLAGLVRSTGVWLPSKGSMNVNLPVLNAAVGVVWTAVRVVRKR